MPVEVLIFFGQVRERKAFPTLAKLCYPSTDIQVAPSGRRVCRCTRDELGCITKQDGYCSLAFGHGTP
jgi:hypothetical protein